MAAWAPSFETYVLTFQIKTRCTENTGTTAISASRAWRRHSHEHWQDHTGKHPEHSDLIKF